MSRLEAWIDEDDLERQDVAFIVKDRAIQMHLYRKTKLSDNDGFREQDPNPSYRYIRKIYGRIDRKNRTFANQEGEVSKSVDVYFIATIYSKDIKRFDRIHFDGVDYEVKAVNTIGQSFTEAELEVQE